MKVRVSKRGRVVLPSQIRKLLAVRRGDSLEVAVEGGRIVLTPMKLEPKLKPRIVRDPLTGFFVLRFAKGAPVLTTKDVKRLLAEFP